MTPAAAVLLAHGGGVPEAATIGLPVLLFTAFLLLERRARRREREAEREAGSEPGEGDTSDLQE